MIRALIKYPGKYPEIKEFKNVNEIYSAVGRSVEFRTFNYRNNIGVYINDDGYLSGKPKNFIFDGSIIYGTAVFVGLNDDGVVKKLTTKQLLIIENYLDHNSLISSATLKTVQITIR